VIPLAIDSLTLAVDLFLLWLPISFCLAVAVGHWLHAQRGPDEDE